VAISQNYILTSTAEQDFRDAKIWSRKRWGAELTKQYFQNLHNAANDLAQNYQRYKSRDDLNGDTGLSIYAIREHYLIYIPLINDRIIIVALTRQVRDVPAILKTHAVHIKSEVSEILRTLPADLFKPSL
jgi:plasmid stabilization system protein ParE